MRLPPDRRVTCPAYCSSGDIGLPSDTLIYDLQYRLRCRNCNGRSGFSIAVVDGRARGDRRVQLRERIIVPGE